MTKIKCTSCKGTGKSGWNTTLTLPCSWCQGKGEHLPVPYPMFCHHPEKCAGKGNCPRDPSCCD